MSTPEPISFLPLFSASFKPIQTVKSEFNIVNHFRTMFSDFPFLSVEKKEKNIIQQSTLIF